MKVLYSEWEKRENDRRKFELLIHGGKIDESITTVSARSSSPNDYMMFRDPKEYESMTKEEREELTRKMMKGHKEILERSKSSLLH